MLNNNIETLENLSKFKINEEEKQYVLDKLNTIIKNFNKLENVPKTNETFFYKIEDFIF